MDAENDILELRRRVARLEALLPRPFELGGAGAGGGGTWVLVTAHQSGTLWTCTVYGDGRYDDAGVAKAASATGLDLQLPNVNAAETGVIGEYFLAVQVDSHYEAKGTVWG